MADTSPKPDHIDERRLVEWAAYGIRMFEVYLCKQALFAAYLRRHNREDPP